MRREGVGVVTPDSVIVKIKSSWQRAVIQEATRRTSRDSRSSSRWINGITSNAHEMGMLIEYAVADYLGHSMDFSRHRDGGVDFTYEGVSVDVKGTVRMNVAAICDWEVDRGKSHVYVFARIAGHFVQIQGYLTIGPANRVDNSPTGLRSRYVRHQLLLRAVLWWRSDAVCAALRRRAVLLVHDCAQ